MGIHASAPKPDVDLLPPRFDRRTSSLDRVPVAPFEYKFGAEKRDKLFSNYFSAPGSIQVQGTVHPDYEEKSRVTVGARVGKSGVAGGALTLGYTDTESAGDDGAPMQWSAAAHLTTDGDVRATLSALDFGRGVGMYALLPLEGPLASAGAATHPFARDAGRGIGSGINGAPVRITHLRDVAAPSAAPAAQGGAVGIAGDPAAVVSPTAVTAAAADAPATAAGLRVYPELGARYLGERFSVGAHVSPFESMPFKVWYVGSHNDAFDAGVQISGSAASVLQSLTNANAQAPAMNQTTGARDPAALAAALRNAISVDAAVSVRQDPLYEVSLALDGDRQEIVAGYIHNMTTRRNVYNPLAESHVKGIYNYVDLGVELRRSIVPPFPSAIALGASWQLNRNLMFKGRISTRDVSVSAAFKTWWDPSFTICATAGMDTLRRTSGIGVSLHIEKGGQLQYQKAVAGYQTVAPSKSMIAQPQLSQRETTTVDRQPFAPPPLGAASRPARMEAMQDARTARWL